MECEVEWDEEEECITNDGDTMPWRIVWQGYG